MGSTGLRATIAFKKPFILHKGVKERERRREGKGGKKRREGGRREREREGGENRGEGEGREEMKTEDVCQDIQ